MFVRSLPVLVRTLLLLPSLLAPTSASGDAPPPCPGTATLTVFADNPTSAPIDISVTGRLVADAATCAGAGELTYSEPLTCPAGSGSCGSIPNLRPGAWIHPLSVQLSGADAQNQAQRSVVVAGDPIGVSNAVAWTLYPGTYVVTNTRSDESDGGLLSTLKAAANDPSGHALVTFSREAFPGADAPGKIVFAGMPCSTDDHDAGVCFSGSGVVVDGLDRNAATGAVVWSVMNEVSLLEDLR